MKISSSFVARASLIWVIAWFCGCRARRDSRQAPSPRSATPATSAAEAPVYGIDGPIAVRTGEAFVYLVRANRSCTAGVEVADRGLVKELGRAIETDGFAGGRAFRIRFRAEKPGKTVLRWSCDDAHHGETPLTIAP